MCYPSPGPRCTAHATKVLRTAMKTYKKKPNVDTMEALVAAQATYDATPGGIRDLQKRLKTDITAKNRLDAGRSLREHQLALLGLGQDYGDIEDTNSKTWDGALILEQAHRAGLEAEEKAKVNGDADLVDTNRNGWKNLIESASRVENAHTGEQQQVIVKRKGTPIQDVAKNLLKGTTSDPQAHSIEGRKEPEWWMRDTSYSAYAVKTKRGDAYNIAFAQSLEKHGIPAQALQVSLPSNLTQLQDVFIAQKDEAIFRKGRANNSKEMAKYAAYENALERVNAEMLTLNERTTTLSEGDKYKSLRALAKKKATEHSEKREKHDAQAWKEISTVLKWSAARNRRENSEV